MEKINKILACPNCHQSTLIFSEKTITCSNCQEQFDRVHDKPFLLLHNSEIRLDFYQTLNRPKKKSLLSKIPLPTQRIWTRKSRHLVTRILKENDPRLDEHCVLNMGSGSEPVYQKLLQPYDAAIIRVGLPHDGKIDVYGDAMQLPIANESVDLLLSSSVFEHIKNPEKAAAEIFRILKKNGKVYAEIPFMRGFHMEPIDYQRYTIEGIEQLFERHGFTLLEKGICSGTFTTLSLIFTDFLISITPKGLKFPVRFITTWLSHPIKFLDRLFENSTWNYKLACNFYYYGQKAD